jgi:hypothetical protein
MKTFGPTKDEISEQFTILFNEELCDLYNSSAEVKNTWSYTSTLPYLFMAWYFVKYRDNFTYLVFLG